MLDMFASDRGNLKYVRLFITPIVCAQRLYLRPIICIALSAPRRTTHAYTAQDRPVDMASLATTRSPCCEQHVAAHEATTSCNAFTAQDFDAHGNNNASVSASGPLMKQLQVDINV